VVKRSETTGIHQKQWIALWQERERFVACPRPMFRSTTFQQEYVAMLERGLVEYEERYHW
jgi:hypothetical protein